MLTHRFPYPPNRGDRIRSYNLLRVLTQSCDVTLGSIVDEPVLESQRLHIQKFCQQVLIDRPGKLKRLFSVIKSILVRKSITEGMFASPSLAKQILQIHRQSPFDVVLVFCSSMFPYVDHPDFKHAKIVVDLVDVDSRKWEQMSQESSFPKNQIFQRESRRVSELEQRIAETADAVILVSNDEAAVFCETAKVPKSQSVLGVSNGVDTEFFQPIDRRDLGSRVPAFGEITPPPEVPATSATMRLVFTGVMNYSPNVSGMEWFCHHVLPELQKKIAVSLQIVGKSPNAKIQSLGKLNGVEVVGPVPDMRPYLAAADIAISPLKLARGIQNKVLEAMAMGRPVVCTTQSAQGIDGDNGTHFVIADTVEDWCRALTDLHTDPDQRQQLSEAARNLVVDSYSWPARLNSILKLLSPDTKSEPSAEVVQTVGTA